MFGLGSTELIVILLIVLLLFGPNRLPELAKGLGKMIHELRHASTQVRDEIHREVNNAEAAARETSSTPVAEIPEKTAVKTS